jgi:hypothetical protein
MAKNQKNKVMEIPLEEPEDLGVKIGSKEEVFWTEVKNKSEEGILNAKREIKINEHVITLADKMIDEEQKV